MMNVAQNDASRKPAKSFYAHLYDQPGVLAKVDGILYFFADCDVITEVEPDMCQWLTVLGEVGIADTQRIMDQIHGGVAAICCTRQMEVQ